MQSKGFTLLEVIVVIAILGIITAICIPKNTIRKQRLNSQARLLTNEIRMIRYKTMTEGGSPSITLDESGYKILEGSSHVKTVELGEDIIIGNNLTNRARMRFSPSGTPRHPGSIRLLDTVTMDYYDITIVPYTGRILLKEVN